MNKPDLTVLRDMLAVREAIALAPQTFDMGYWRADIPSCGTTLCLAGHLAMLRGYGFGFETYTLRPIAESDRFHEDIGIPEDHWLWYANAYSLDSEGWPTELRELYRTDPIRAGQFAIDRWAEENFTPEEIAQAKADMADPLARLVTAKQAEGICVS